MDSDKLHEESFQPTKRNGTDRAGSTEEITPAKASDQSGSKVMARRTSMYGGSADSVIQSAIGGPFGGRTGNSESKAAMIDKLPA